ncbi:hypothetical protein [Armatimonas sp.]|uniref:hypothetical protein n=1 Tax=Armatimonas sp. TaxID=1872638 RepID=UPI003752C4DD
MHYTIPESVHNFRDYFKLRASPREVAEALGYTFMVDTLALPRTDDELPWAEPLRERLTQAQRSFSLVNETERRELLLAPIVFELGSRYPISVRWEYDIHAGPQLKGTLDYLLEAQRRLLVVEAKQADLVRGFQQLAAELAALDVLTPPEVPVLYGALSGGDTWRFGVLNRATKTISQSLTILRVPDDLTELLQTLLGILAINTDIEKENKR